MFGFWNCSAVSGLLDHEGDCLAKSSRRVLVVDDFEPFRRLLCSTLQDKLELPTIVGGSDGVEAIELAEALQPDLILLDIGLPKINGIEAARRIQEFALRSKILFVSQELSVEVVQAAFSAGASGYVVKMDVGAELLIAIEAVLQGERFVGRRFAGHGFTVASDARTPTIVRRHEAGLYSEDRRLLDDVTQFIGAALKAGNAAIVVATESHRNSLISKLQLHGVDIPTVIEQGRYISLDAADVLSTFMVNGMPDPVRFLKLFGNLIATAAESAKSEQARVAVFGEGVHLLWAQGNAEAALQVEELSSEIVRTYDVDILCGYSVGSFQGGVDSPIFQQICAAHSAVHSR
jgi:DNA-binding NarL/FixJ family response regulator